MNESSTPQTIVGIGASAGGLEALKEFFEATPPDIDIAWVVVQHLSPDYKSVMAELLSSSTKMPIHTAEAGAEPLANNIYLIPSNKNLRLDKAGKFTLETQDRIHSRPNLPINIFFESLAEFKGKLAIGVVLSGTGSDGTRGTRAIREQGGIVLVQSVATAKFDGMPKSIIENDLADFIDSPAKLPDHITGYLDHPITQSDTASTEIETLDRAPLARIFDTLENRYRIDFSQYKSATVGRRIERRITKTQKASLEDYVHFLSSSPDEAEALLQELLIGVTSFFRDLSVFTTMQMTHLPNYLDTHRLGTEFRCWIAGCSTGEEAYTVAIILSEIMEQRESKARIKIFATDLNGRAISRASSGAYPKSIANDLPAEILSKYFKASKDHFVINRAIREKVVFAKHDVVNDPPFTRIDLIVCRNMLIYLDNRAQHQVLTSFSFALNESGLLLLGLTESLGEAQELYRVVDKSAKLFENVGKVRGTSLHMSYAKEKSRFEAELKEDLPTTRRNATTTRLREELRLYGTLLDALPQVGELSFGLLVNERNEVLRILGSSKIFLKPLSGTIDVSLKKLLCDALQLPVNSAMLKAFSQSKMVKMRGVNVNIDGEDVKVTITVMPLETRKTLVNHAFITLAQEQKSVTVPDHILMDSELDRSKEIKNLENELQITRENLQSTIEELETSNEELQATNEELLASNEELQSTNEELQSVNEELFTINNEHQERHYQMAKMRTEMSSILAAARIATIILDEELRIQSYSNEAVRVFNLIDRDIGHHIKHISHHLADIDVAQLASEVLKSGEAQIREVETAKQGRYSLILGIIDHQEIGDDPGIAVVIQGPFN